MLVVVVLQDLPEGKVKRSILDSFKNIQFYVVYIVMGFKGPGTAVMALEMSSQDKGRIKSSITIHSKTVKVTVLPPDLNDTYIYGISDETRKMFASETSLNHYVKLTMDQITEAETENFFNGKNRVEDIKYDLERTLDSSQYKLYSFGSRDSGLGLPSSDCDWFIDTGNMYNGTKDQSQEELVKQILKLYNIFKEHPKTYSNLTQILHTRVPIIRFKHETTGLNCDLQCKNGISIENTHLVKKYFTMDPRVKWVVIAVKIWSKQNDLIGFKKFTSYALMWMTMYVLMQVDVVVPVAYLQNMYKGEKKTISDWECGFCQGPTPVIPKSSNKMSVHELLQLFFYFYGRPNRESFKDTVLCPLVGAEMRKESFQNLSLPPAFDNYVNSIKSKKGRDVEYFNLDCVLCVQDPLELSHNITKYVDGAILKRFKMLCTYSADHLDETIGKKPNIWKKL